MSVQDYKLKIWYRKLFKRSATRSHTIISVQCKCYAMLGGIGPTQRELSKLPYTKKQSRCRESLKVLVKFTCIVEAE